MSDITKTQAEPIPIRPRRWNRELLKIAAAFVVFAVVGLVLVLTLRDDEEPRIVAPGPTPTAAPSTTAPAATPSAAATVTTAPTEALSPADATATARVAAAQATLAAMDAVGATATAEAAASATAAWVPPPAIIATIPVGRQPWDLAFGAGSIWVPNGGDGTVSRIDPATNEVVATIEISPTSDDSPVSVAVRGNAVWVTSAADQTLVRIDPATNQIVQTIPVTSGDGGALALDGLAVGEQALWVTGLTPEVIRIDPTSGEVVARIQVDNSGAFKIALTETALWVQSRTTIYRIDPATNEIVAAIEVPDEFGLLGIAASETSVWSGGRTLSRIYRVDPATNQLVATLEPGMENPVAFALTDDSVWIASNTLSLSNGENSLLQIDLASNEIVGRLPLDVNSMGITAGEGSVWVSQIPDVGDHQVLRVDAE